MWGFDKHYRLFRETAQIAKHRFELADWRAVHNAARDRILFYDQRVEETVERLRKEFKAESLNDDIWLQVKFHFVALLIEHKQPECAESFYNSVTCRILHRDYFNNDYIFVRPTISTDYLDSDPPAYRSYYPESVSGLRETFQQIVLDANFSLPFPDLEHELDCIVENLSGKLGRDVGLQPNRQVQVLRSPFFRNKGCYLIGKIVNGFQETPFALAILHERRQALSIDALLLERDYIQTLFSFARAYFFVDMEVPSQYVAFLRTIMPRKPKAELYAMLGLAKLSKTLFYRDFLHHLKHSSDQFVLAPGIKGLVMLVFTLPSFPYVFKVIKDVIGGNKEINREGVKQKYLLVKQHDRAGRMADTLEYSNVAFPRERFSEELVRELQQLAPSMIEISSDSVVLHHLYIERYITPLNLYMQQCSDEELEPCLIDYGNAIKELAAANIFPGDMLYKNFGVSRQGRVVFYDYDEIEYMTTCQFRDVPTSPHDEDELSSEPWYPVGKYDVFPEEFPLFLLGDPKVRRIMMQHHPDLFTAHFWDALKTRIASGQVESVFPYPQEMRFTVGNGAENALPRFIRQAVSSL